MMEFQTKQNEVNLQASVDLIHLQNGLKDVLLAIIKGKDLQESRSGMQIEVVVKKEKPTINCWGCKSNHYLNKFPNKGNKKANLHIIPEPMTQLDGGT